MQAQDAVPIIVRMLRACDVKFEESKHPRGQPKNAGQFAEKEGAASAKPGRTPKGSALSSQPANVINKALDKHNVRVFESIETARVLKAIEKHIGMNAVEMRQQLAQKISSQAGEVGLDIITADDKTIKYRVHGRGAGGRQTFTVTQTIDVQKKTAELSLFQVSKAMQGKGIAKSFVRNLLDVYSKAGIGKIDMEANVDVGAYAWARYGWVPKSPGEWSKLKRNIQEYTLSDAPAEERPTIKIILRDKDPKAIRALVAQPSGFKLMKGLSWKGVLDLTNAETKRIVYAYCG